MKQSKGIILILLIITICFLTLKQETYLEIRHDKQIQYMSKVKIGETFEYSSLHSVSLTRLYETIAIGDNLEFVTIKVKYSDQGGAGMPEYNYGDSEFYLEDGYFVIDHMKQTYKSLAFQVEEQYENTIRFKGNELPLYYLIADKKGSLELTINKTSLLVYLIKQSYVFM